MASNGGYPSVGPSPWGAPDPSAQYPQQGPTGAYPQAPPAAAAPGYYPPPSGAPADPYHQQAYGGSYQAPGPYGLATHSSAPPAGSAQYGKPSEQFHGDPGYGAAPAHAGSSTLGGAASAPPAGYPGAEGGEWPEGAEGDESRGVEQKLNYLLHKKHKICHPIEHAKWKLGKPVRIVKKTAQLVGLKK